VITKTLFVCVRLLSRFVNVARLAGVASREGMRACMAPRRAIVVNSAMHDAVSFRCDWSGDLGLRLESL
jgi:hypothetical protein